MVGTKTPEGSKNPAWWKSNVSKQAKENHIYLQLLFTKKLPPELKRRIALLRKILSQGNSKVIEEDLGKLVHEISILGNLPLEHYSYSIEQFILYDIIRPPAINFYITETRDIVSVNFVKKPKKEDWHVAQTMVRQTYDTRPQTPRFNPILYKTLPRQIKHSKRKSTWDKVEIDSKNKQVKIENDTKKRNVTKQDKHRFGQYLKRFEKE